METSRARRRKILYALTGILSAFIFLFLFWKLSPLLLPTIIGVLLAYLFKPLINSFKFFKIPEGLSVVLLLSLFCYGLFNAYIFIKSQIPDENQKIELMVRVQYKFNEKYNSLMGLDNDKAHGNFIHSLLKNEITPFIDTVNKWLELNKQQQSLFISNYNNTTPAEIKRKYFSYFLHNQKLSSKSSLIEDSADTVASSVVTSIDHNTSLLGKIVNTLSTWLVLPFVFIFLLFDKGKTPKYLIQKIPNKYFELSLTVIDEVDIALGNYLRGTLLQCALVGLSLTLGLFIIGLNFKVAILIGLFAGVSNAIPFLGPVIGLVFGMSYALIIENIDSVLPFITDQNLVFAVLVIVLFVQFLDNSIYQPFVLGSVVNLHPLVIVLGVMGGSLILGVAGMLLAIPTIVIFKVIFGTLFRELKSYKII